MKFYNFLTLPSKVWGLIVRIILYFPVIPYATLFILAYFVDRVFDKENTAWGPLVTIIPPILLSLCGIALSVIAIIRFIRKKQGRIPE